MTQPVKKVKSRSTNQMLAIIPINDDVILWTFLDFPQIVTDSESQVQTQKKPSEWWVIGHGLIIEILAHVFCAISQLSDPNNPYYGASIEITHFLKFFKISNFSEISTCRIDSNQRQRNETPLDSSKIISKSRLRRRESGQGKIRTLRTTEIPFYPLYPLTTVPLKSKIMYFHQLLWFLCYHLLSDF